MHNLIKAVAASAVLAMSATSASSHAVSIGFENAGPGSVTVWLGTYAHGTPTNEGSLSLEGVGGTVFGPTTNMFDLLTLSMPTGLIDGVTNFYAGLGPVGTPGLADTEVPFNTIGCPACGPIDHWQGVTFAGLTAGDYQFNYVPIANPSQEWTPWNDDLNGIFTLTGAVVNPNPGGDGPGVVPLPAGLPLLLVGLGAFGIVARRRKA